MSFVSVYRAPNQEVMNGQSGGKAIVSVDQTIKLLTIMIKNTVVHLKTSVLKLVIKQNGVQMENYRNFTNPVMKSVEGRNFVVLAIQAKSLYISCAVRYL